MFVTGDKWLSAHQHSGKRDIYRSDAASYALLGVTVCNVTPILEGCELVKRTEEIYINCTLSPSAPIFVVLNDGDCKQMSSNIIDDLPDVRDGLARKERIVLYCLDQLQQERGERNVPTAMLYGRVIERVNMSLDDFQAALTKFRDRLNFSD